ncbi:uncharacterized protein BJ212DRAFT_108825 [Suillus subaureus]|uniref:Secreted protein n=1 Tax=Suillus subaureus TaxID=48587 RepID=A0A9P7EEW7_9AGAM|nr:uncharacterized protein BJ212DRAFT_108825 [Suillus subaureus]KAG1818758.1 hypothetical protein BJ212DRAFT_108825 [Suillus subaureus]
MKFRLSFFTWSSDLFLPWPLLLPTVVHGRPSPLSLRSFDRKVMATSCTDHVAVVRSDELLFPVTAPPKSKGIQESRAAQL